MGLLILIFQTGPRPSSCFLRFKPIKKIRWFTFCKYFNRFRTIFFVENGRSSQTTASKTEGFKKKQLLLTNKPVDMILNISVRELVTRWCPLVPQLQQTDARNCKRASATMSLYALCRTSDRNKLLFTHLLYTEKLKYLQLLTFSLYKHLRDLSEIKLVKLLRYSVGIGILWDMSCCRVIHAKGVLLQMST